MKKILLATIALMTVYASIAEARYTNSYYRQDGTFVNGYYSN